MRNNDEQEEYIEQSISYANPELGNERENNLIVVNNSDLFSNYITKYSEKYKSLSSNDPEVIFFKNCLFKTHIFGNSGKKYILEDCTIELNTSHTNEDIKIQKIIRCDIALSGNQNILNCKKIIDSTFKTRCIFNCSDGSITEFYRTRFFDELVCNCKATIESCQIKRLCKARAKIEIHSSTIESLQFSSVKDIHANNCIFEEVTFDDCKLNSAIFENVVFKTSPTLIHSEFTGKNVEFYNVSFNDLKSGKALGTFRQLKKMCEDAGYENGIIKFHALELKTHYNLNLSEKRETGTWPEAFSSVFYRIFTDYGINIAKPIYSIFAFMIVGFEINFFILENQNPPFIFDYYITLLHIKSSLLCSFKNSIGPLILALPDTGKTFCNEISSTNILPIFAFIQITVCSIIWFLIIFMIRRRFKL